MSQINGNLYVNGLFQASAMAVPDNSVGNLSVRPADPIQPDRTVTRHVVRLAQQAGAPTAAERRTLYEPYRPGTLVAVWASQSTPNGAGGTVTISVLKNNASVLSSTFQLTAATGAYVRLPASVNPAAAGYGAADSFEVVVAVSGAAGSGLCVSAVFDERP